MTKKTIGDLGNKSYSGLTGREPAGGVLRSMNDKWGSRDWEENTFKTFHSKAKLMKIAVFSTWRKYDNSHYHHVVELQATIILFIFPIHSKLATLNIYHFRVRKKINKLLKTSSRAKTPKRYKAKMHQTHIPVPGTHPNKANIWVSWSEWRVVRWAPWLQSRSSKFTEEFRFIPRSCYGKLYI